MEKFDFRPPMIKNISTAFTSPALSLSAVCFPLAAGFGLLGLPLAVPLLAVWAALILKAVLLFCLLGAAKVKRGMRPAAAAILRIFYFLAAAAVVAAGAVSLFWPQYFPSKTILAAVEAAYISKGYEEYAFWALLGLAAACLFGFGLFFGSVHKSLIDGVPRRKGTGLLCLFSFLTAAAYGALMVFYTRGRDFSAVVRFDQFLSYNFIPVLPAFFFVLGTGFLCITCLKYSGAVKRSTNV